MTKKIKIDSQLYGRIKKAAESAGYSGPDEFVTHAIEKALAGYESSEDDAKVADRLRGLGYIE